ncbi:hypothetical protein [Heyndrickxia coagulans]|uniref:LysM domain-containing protein n=1 Tax=Heyndrickxia coagulans TaxID=1398 RepID=A0AAW7CCS8_HEYCO|nr:hypothetical protein [Heyndrickxia coagulans]MDL5041038.1 hypothetical protein [Heyndrickxia coagulans]
MLKKIAVLFFAALISYCIYYDLHAGTIPTNAKETAGKTVAVQPQTTHRPYVTAKVHSGDTVLTIVKQISGGPAPSIEKAIRDFSKLNGGIAPEDIQTGQTYRFPIYGESR